ncbi:MAG: hypothetical protein JXA43_03770 [Candidatus Diapherotrites archaeon]|nr:hypothetical protein [Candidatus Diapherotrites archaeon]
MAKLIPLLIILVILPTVFGYAAESTFREIGISNNVYIDSNTTNKSINMTYKLPEDIGAYYITLNAYGENSKIRVSVNKNLVNILNLSDFGEDRTYELRVDNKYLNATNEISITGIMNAEDGFLEINVDESKMGIYESPIISVQKSADARILEEGQSIAVIIALKNTGYSTANISVVDELPPYFVVTSGNTNTLMTLKPEEEKNIEYTLKAIKETELTLGNPKITFTDGIQYKDVVFLNPYTQHIYIENPEPQIRITNNIEKSILDKGNTTNFSLLIENTGLIPVDSIIVTLNRFGGISVDKEITAVSGLSPGQQSKVDFVITASKSGGATIGCQIQYMFGKEIRIQDCGITTVHVNEESLFIPIVILVVLIVVCAILFAVYRRLNTDHEPQMSLDAVMGDLQERSRPKWAHKKHKKK